MGLRERRHDALISELRSGERHTAAELGVRLGVSTRSIRDYVREINDRSGAPLVLADQSGYRLDQRAYHRFRAELTRRPRGYEGPEQRLYHIVRHLVTHADGSDVFELGEELNVSPSTIEADLGRARELLREHRLSTDRHGNRIRIVGPERQQRRLVRYLLLNAGQGVLDGSPPDLGTPQQRARLRTLHARAREALTQADLDVNEYVLNDLLLHLAIAAERVAAGRQLGVSEPSDRGDVDRQGAVWGVTGRLVAAVAEVFDVPLPQDEQRALHDLLVSRSRTASPATSEDATCALALEITRDALRQISDHFMLDLYDEETLTGLSLHVRKLIERSRAGDVLSSPLGPAFRRTHPLIHELALCLSREIEKRAGIRIAGGEVDFLAFHLGNQVLRQLDQGPPVTVTLVLPRYGAFSEQLEHRITAALPDHAVVSDVISSLTHDWHSVASDLVVSVVDLTPAPPAPVATISPFLGQEDLDHIAEVVRRERRRAGRDILRSTLLSLLDPDLFVHVGATTKDKALCVMAGRLQDRGYVDPGFLDDVLDRKARSSTAFGSTFAIPHSMYMDARKTGISVLTSESGIPWGGASVRLVLMFAISPDRRAVFRDVLDRLTELLGTPNHVRRLLEHSSDYRDFVRELVGLVSD